VERSERNVSIDNIARTFSHSWHTSRASTTFALVMAKVARRIVAIPAIAGALLLFAGTYLHSSAADPNVPSAAFAENAAKGAAGAGLGMSDVRKWLEAIGLTQYANAFEANDIDMDPEGHRYLKRWPSPPSSQRNRRVDPLSARHLSGRARPGARHRATRAAKFI
jgi:SAM (Sterile alpha motif) domain-containing protein